MVVWEHDYKQKNKERFENMSHVFEELADDEIISIEYVGAIDTIDIETSGNHLFMANGILTHNSSHDADTDSFGHKDIAGGMSKINTADNVLAIYVTAAMKESGRYQLQFLKTRSSSGVGSKVDLKFDPRTLRVFDLEAGEEGALSTQTRTMLDRLRDNDKKKDAHNGDAPPPPTTSIENVNRLHGILNKIHPK